MGNRSRTEIVCNILDAANGVNNQDKKNVLCISKLAQLNEYLSLLTENNLIEYLDGTQTFKTKRKD